MRITRRILIQEGCAKADTALKTVFSVPNMSGSGLLMHILTKVACHELRMLDTTKHFTERKIDL